MFACILQGRSRTALIPLSLGDVSCAVYHFGLWYHQINFPTELSFHDHELEEAGSVNIGGFGLLLPLPKKVSTGVGKERKEKDTPIAYAMITSHWQALDEEGCLVYPHSYLFSKEFDVV
jgi:hypothetical protein